jgi:hypothetical protein
MRLFGSPATHPPASPGSSLRFGVVHTSGRRVVPSDRPADAWAHPRVTVRDKKLRIGVSGVGRRPLYFVRRSDAGV